ncbi:malonyl-CoA synthase [Rhodobacteraceae bacterium HSP-20]|uniref:Malonyl-CoA synthase n=1 Tax=Paragemmobacter amnigenus TaxID=2852097 RepID=A0ABS6J0Q4_9RHOB|nr:malonyl-CoA synthase [Rhodobacter amnigenus]MBU9697102.1 malonyl-CoA synthase [Rhodobacter amnigenus]MBV4388329.1 malonyl-CoA synthase [Rhodobacter amnigenus]
MTNMLYDALFAPLAGRETPLLILRDGREVTGDAFLRLVLRQAGALAALGLGKGDRIAVQVAKTPEALAIYGAAVALGAVFLPLNTAYTAAEVEYFLGNATPRIFVCDSGTAAALAPVAERNGARLLTLDAAGRGSLSDLADGAEPLARVAACGPDDLAAFLYTSGTTGRSKGAMLSHRNLLSNAEVLVREWRFTAGDVLLHALPIFHTHGLFVASNVALLAGARMIWLPGFEAGAVLAALPRASVMMGVPTFYTRLLDEAGLDRALVGHMRLFVSGSAPLLAETHEAWEARTGHRILERYGMTETNMNTSNPYEGERRAGTVGHPLPGVELRILVEGREAAVDEVGMIEVRGPNVFVGYWQMPEKTREELRPDGWFITGDLGKRDADGYVHIVGRAKDLVITGGYNVYPKEVELLLDEVPGVAESAVIGVPHPDFGEAVFAVLVPERGTALEAGAVLAAIADRLARFKQPKAAVVVEALPRNTMGKVQKNVLRESYKGWFAGQGEI